MFPDPRGADADGLVAIGGDLCAERLLLAYSRGIFPWFNEDTPPLWWSPDPRAVLQNDTLHVARSLRRSVRRSDFRLTWNTAFEAVIDACAENRDGGTWILPEMREAYVGLHRSGHAYSAEVWSGDRLVGGLYGVQRGGLFAAESMFHRATDASKVALVSTVRSLFEAGIVLFDVQFTTEHLASMGAREWSREHYLRELGVARTLPVDLHHIELRFDP